MSRREEEGHCPPPTRQRKRAAAQKKNRNRPAMRRFEEYIVSIVGPQDQWPREIIRAFKGVLIPNRTERFKVTVFLYTNGIDEDDIMKWYDMSTILNDCERRNIRRIIERYPMERWTAWKPLEGRSGRL